MVLDTFHHLGAPPFFFAFITSSAFFNALYYFAYAI